VRGRSHDATIRGRNIEYKSDLIVFFYELQYSINKGILEMDPSNRIFDCIWWTSSTTLHVAILIMDRLYNQNLDNLLKYLG
jgi:hypothetical protein